MLGAVDVCPNGASNGKRCLVDGWLGVNCPFEIERGRA